MLMVLVMFIMIMSTSRAYGPITRLLVLLSLFFRITELSILCYLVQKLFVTVEYLKLVEVLWHCGLNHLDFFLNPFHFLISILSFFSNHLQSSCGWCGISFNLIEESKELLSIFLQHGFWASQTILLHRCYFSKPQDLILLIFKQATQQVWKTCCARGICM